jgi:hypothetical protein
MDEEPDYKILQEIPTGHTSKDESESASIQFLESNLSEQRDKMSSHEEVQD